MVKFGLYFFSFVLIFYAGCTNEKRAAQKQAKIEIAKRIDINNVVESIQNTIKIQLATMQRALADSVYQNMISASESSFSEDSLRFYFDSYFEEHDNFTDPDSLVNWLKAPLYTKILSADSAELGENDIRRIIEIANYYQNDSTLTRRFLYIQSATRTREIELTADAYAATFRALLEANRMLVDRNGKMSDKDVELIVDIERKDFLKRLNSEMLFEKLYRYRNFSDDELIQITEFKNSVDGAKLSDLIHQAILYSIKKANLNFLNKTSKLVS